MSRRASIRKRERQKLRFANRPKPVPVETPSKTRGLIREALEQPSPLAQALLSLERNLGDKQ
jgi:hypothetical protein